MAIRLSKSVSKGAISYYIVKDVINPKTGRRTTRAIEKLGTFKDWSAQLQTDDPQVVWEHLTRLVKQKKEEQAGTSMPVQIEMQPQEKIRIGEGPLAWGGALVCAAVLNALDLPALLGPLGRRMGLKEDQLFTWINDRVSAGLCRSSQRIFYPVSSLQLNREQLQLLAQHRSSFMEQLLPVLLRFAPCAKGELVYDCQILPSLTPSSVCGMENGLQAGLVSTSAGLPLLDILFFEGQPLRPEIAALFDSLKTALSADQILFTTVSSLNEWEEALTDQFQACRVVQVLAPETLDFTSFFRQDLMRLSQDGTEPQQCLDLGRFHFRQDSQTPLQLFGLYVRDLAENDRQEMQEALKRRILAAPRSETAGLNLSGASPFLSSEQISQDRASRILDRHSGLEGVRLLAAFGDACSMEQASCASLRHLETTLLDKVLFPQSERSVLEDDELTALEIESFFRYLSLLVLRVLSLVTGGTWSQTEILRAVDSVITHHVEEAGWMPAFRNTELLQSIFSFCSLPFDNRLILEDQGAKMRTRLHLVADQD